MPEVEVVILKPESVTLTTELPGRAAVYQMAEIRPQVSGIIRKRAFTEGSEVKAGALLYQIDPDSYEVAVARAEAALAQAKAELEPIRLRAKRYGELIRSKAVSQQDYDDAQAALALAQAGIARAKAELDGARIDLRRTKVVSPISGRIGRSGITPGALVTANQPQAMALVQQLDPIYVDLTQSSTELMRLKRALATGTVQAAQTAEIRIVLEDGTPYPHPGTLKLAEASVDPGTGAVTLRAEVPNPDRDLLPGMFVRAIITEGTLNDAILVPQEAVSYDSQGNALVMAVDDGDTVAVRTVVLGQAAGSSWIVRQGLESGDRIIVSGLQIVRPGMKVRATPLP
jgi:membrane fusion protein (multidrug efflux system)